jgi:hypothetical protein
MPLFPSPQALALVATTGPSGYVLVDGTGNIITWTAPDDGQLHRYLIFVQQIVTSDETGGELAIQFTGMDGNVYTEQFSAPGLTAGFYGPASFAFTSGIIKAGTALTISQFTALTGGAATLWPEIWGS